MRLLLLAALFLLGSAALVGLLVIFRAGGEPREERVVLVGAGDIARCDDDGDEATGRLLEGIPGTVFTLGGNAYQRGSITDF